MLKLKAIFRKHPVLVFIVIFVIIVGILMFPYSDGYLMLKILFRMLGGIPVGLVVAFLIAKIVAKKKKLSIKQLLLKNILVILGIVLVAVIVFCYQPCIDIKVGPQKGKMINIYVREKNHTLYLDGAMNGELIKLKVIGDAAEALSLKNGDRYYTLEIEYYKNIKEVCKADIGCKAPTWD